MNSTIAEPVNGEQPRGLTTTEQDAAQNVANEGREGSIRLTDIQISPLSRAHNVEINAHKVFLDELAEDISAHGLLHPLLLVRSPTGAPVPYHVLAGAHRLLALRRIRGPEGQLEAGEYKLLTDDLSAEDQLAISLSENAKRTESPPAVRAAYYCRLISEHGISQSKLEALTGRRRQWISAAVRLRQRWDELPSCWQRDLAWFPGGMLTDTVVITMTHWAEVCGKLPKDGIPGELHRLMIKWREKKLSARKLAAAVEDYVQRILGSGAMVESAEAESEVDADARDAEGAGAGHGVLSAGVDSVEANASQPDQSSPHEDYSGPAPDYDGVIAALEGLIQLCGWNHDLEKSITKLIRRVYRYRED